MQGNTNWDSIPGNGESDFAEKSKYSYLNISKY